ncbi:hypothetical protein KC363_g8517 [Hortaea werneckii]|uniref:DUF1690 domain-containing protein n=1 Tax=Hortaea werneckii TaxID=91943 RepID=A0A3M7FY78_HORWE|nr:hypothetical protein KC361_g2831 [Hortaea werneckii]KAI6877223.1 hypothetical protein KC325_g9248 [Hortaea werneckii]KAI6997217.1 hypothetical protein KC359_g3054 [Hortaea werneckii]KAI7140516.1 hypothetical protein KC344_g8665 [Hortaea werneckii]KAI7167463.1 hypothetical protein KC360_g8635 [Hortaea werneckii]
MGSGSSKPEQHMFNADAPVSFSQNVLNSLQTNPESDTTRARTAELKVQHRVNAELQRIRDTQAQQLEQLTASLTTSAAAADDDTTVPSTALITSDPSKDPTSLAYHLSSPFYQDHSGGANASATSTAHTLDTPLDSGRSHASVAREIMDLKTKLEQRKRTDKASPEVEKAKESMVQCLRLNDRRPLDCWQEVEQFKREVGRLERGFVEKVGR